MKLNIYTTGIFCLVFCLTSIAQTLSPRVQPTQGGYQSNGGYNLSWTMGQTYQATLTAGSSMLTQGFQQPEVDIVTSAVIGSPFCAGSVVSVSFTATGFVVAGNVFTAQLSDASGGFGSPINIGTLAGTASGSISASIPSGTGSGTGYRIRVVSSLPTFNGSNNSADLTINTPITWYLDADADGWYVNTQTACTSPGTGWTSTLPAGGSGDCDDADSTVWQLLSGYVDADGDGYTVGGLLNNICSGASLPSGYSATSLGADCNDNNAAINPGAAEICGNGIDENCNGSDLACGSSVGVTINITGTHIICKDESLTLNATPSYSNCPSTGFQWYRNGNPIPGATATTLTLNRWSVGNYYAAATCGATTVYSDTLKANIVVVTADSNRLCPSAGLELRVEPAPGVTYQWAEGSLTGNIIPGANGTTYTTSYIGNVWCWMQKPACGSYGKFRTFPSKHCGAPAAKWAGSDDELEPADENALPLHNFGMYPNPAGYQVTLETPYINRTDAVRIYDYNGRTVLEQTGMEGYLHTLDISMLSPALYIVEVRTAGETARKKLVVE